MVYSTVKERKLAPILILEMADALYRYRFGEIVTFYPGAKWQNHLREDRAGGTRLSVKMTRYGPLAVNTVVGTHCCPWLS